MTFRSDRERLIVVWGGVIGVLLLWWSLFLQPSLKRIKKYEADIPKVMADVQTAREVAGRLADLKSVPTQAPQGSLAAQLNTIVHQQLHIPADHQKSLKDVGKGAELSLTDIDGATLARLLHALEAARVRPDSVSLKSYVEKSDDRRWDVTIIVTAPATSPGGAATAPAAVAPPGAAPADAGQEPAAGGPAAAPSEVPAAPAPTVRVPGPGEKAAGAGTHGNWTTP